MNEHVLPTQYHLEVYEDSFANDSSLAVQSSTPFSAISAGDFFNHQTHEVWLNPPSTQNEKFVVREVEHVLWTVDGSHNGHKVMILVKKEPHIY
jgi:hypothetical protein